MTTTRIVRHALFAYTDTEGIRRFALRGKQVELSEKDLARGELFGAFEDEGAGPGAEISPSPEAPSLPGTDPAPRPAQVATKAAWVDYAVSRGMDRAAAEAMTKQELIDAFAAAG